jgi:hypothetical protein
MAETWKRRGRGAARACDKGAAETWQWRWQVRTCAAPRLQAESTGTEESGNFQARRDMSEDCGLTVAHSVSDKVSARLGRRCAPLCLSLLRLDQRVRRTVCSSPPCGQDRIPRWVSCGGCVTGMIRARIGRCSFSEARLASKTRITWRT